MDPFRHFGRSPWTGDRPIARPLPTHNTKRKNVDIYPCFERVSKPRSQCPSGPKPHRP